ncbi:MAG: dihydropteroate synthase [bacterium]|nr:dihydropteroate synthase [bacterium]
MKRTRHRVACKSSTLLLGDNTQIMGILNTTPDSFSDGGVYLHPDRAVERAEELVSQGATLIDIGGESSRPRGLYGHGAEPVSLVEEIRRTAPVIERLASRVSTPISIDTTKSEVARQALRAGASIVNDISALRMDPKMAEVVSEFCVPVVLMHMKGTPQTMQNNPIYDDLIAEIIAFFDERISAALKAGIPSENLIIDPGFGFGKSRAHNLQILAELDRFLLLNCPILVGPSRKQFTAPDAPISDRIAGSIAAVTQCILKGAHIVRVHDVWQTRQAVDLIDQVAAYQDPINP